MLVAEMTAEEVIQKHLEAIGGEKALSEIKSLTMTGNMFAGGMPLDFKSYIVRPDKAFIEASTNNFPMFSGGSNGTEAWQKSPMGTILLEGEEKAKAMEQAEVFKFLDYKGKGYTVRFLGEDLIKGAKTYKVELVEPENDTSTFHFDAETFYIVREKSGGNTISYSKHQKVGDKIVQPFKVNIAGSGTEGQAMLTFVSMELNVDVPDSLFVVPEGAIPMSEMMKQQQQQQQTPAGE
jgi:hypothetical protein